MNALASSLPGLRRCDGVTRRDFVRIGGLTALGLGLSHMNGRGQAGEQSSGKRFGVARQCILIWLDGGPSHLETFDLKPDAPREVRGPFQPIATTLSGVSISELMPRIAQNMGDVSIIRSMTSPLGEHNFGTHYLLTGYKPTPALDYPTIGAVLSHQRLGEANHSAESQAALPPHIAVPQFRVGGGRMDGAGFLGEAYRPFSLGSDPAKPGFQVRDLDFFPGLSESRLQRRRHFLQALDHFQRAAEDDTAAGTSPLDQQSGNEQLGNGQLTNDPDFERAYRLITSREAKEAFELEQEPDSVRNRYGRRTVGQSCLLARRLVERGVPFVTVNYPGWDTHRDAYTRLKEGYTGAKVPVGLIPSLDTAFASLIEDLRDRGLLDETLIVVMGEFGRTPKLNTSGGRDHWPRVFSVALAGAGLEGQVIGQSDSVAEGPADRPVTPADLAASLYHLLGIRANTKLYTPDGRPIEVNRDGELVRELVT